MSESKTSVPGAHNRLPYNKPVLTKLTPEEAKAKLETKSIPGDEQERQLMEAINSALERNAKTRKVEGA
jgi:hypothetical protein